MNRSLTSVAVLAALLATGQTAAASTCGDSAMKMFKAYGLSEPPTAGAVPPGDSGGGSRASGVPTGLSDGKQLSPVNRQSVTLLVKQAIQSDGTGDTATCNAKLAAARQQIKTGS